MRTPAPSSTSALGGMFGADDDDEDGTHDTHARREPPGKRKRAVDDFVGELQKQQAQREERYKDRIAGQCCVRRICSWTCTDPPPHAYRGHIGLVNSG